MILLTSIGDDITITNLGTNRALLNGKQLPKETPSNLKDGDVITLVEAKYQILVQLFKKDSVVAQDKSNASNTKASSTTAAAAAGSSSNINTTSSPLRPPPLRSTPPRKKSDFASTTAVGTAEKLITDLPSTSMIPTTTTSITATAAANLPRDQEQHSTPQPQKDTHDMDIDDQSDSTSDSEKDKHIGDISRTSDISDESSFVCEDLSDNDNISDSDE
ncbi:hypothetical protein EC991_005218 [Linnemannia zychae]|nr:hypothetical protein EC991_005218 [Linnemannia zychae]